MQSTQQQPPLNTLPLIPKLDSLLIELLQSLSPEEWQAPTVAKLWTVKDVAAHMLDTTLRGISISRDGFFGEKAENIHSYTDLVAFLNNLNMNWTNAAKRISPQLLISLLQQSCKEYYAHLQTLDLYVPAVFSVAWAGQETSPNWFHIAREYTEKFIHQQQIRDAVSKQALLTKELFLPFIDTFMYALPHTYRNVNAATGATVKVIVTSEAGGEWKICKEESGWQLVPSIAAESDATLSVSPNIVWKLFSKSMQPQDALPFVELAGDKTLAATALQMVSVMA
ncbi:hypothetical protein ESA94_07965 [Lacibacter luteus]|uniref:Mycothiol-dependent maleylpyruvate isomerase metal-binding domain-containing protein n=1 Tax=Lacibacter luteus TaxID=2508719 RepID=A0A4Q1CJ88_9BACT|nr:maleylpyruvate isomerase N-terminal domain-containing protein [Lacibacter luteus]RXK60397.1 hypothetical protein ESA94_07965 [Lacibacter luteus]